VHCGALFPSPHAARLQLRVSRYER
jgi:hypothetical protein